MITLLIKPDMLGLLVVGEKQWKICYTPCTLTEQEREAVGWHGSPVDAARLT
jgi:hypothetical protein